MRKGLTDIKFGEVKEKSFELILVVERLCEVCEKPLDIREKSLKSIKSFRIEDYQNLLDRVRIYDRIEFDVENGRIYLYSHDFPGDIHPECIEKL